MTLWLVGDSEGLIQLEDKFQFLQCQTKIQECPLALFNYGRLPTTMFLVSGTLYIDWNKCFFQLVMILIRLLSETKLEIIFLSENKCFLLLKLASVLKTTVFLWPSFIHYIRYDLEQQEYELISLYELIFSLDIL